MVDYLRLISKHTQGEHEQTVPALIIHSALVTKKALDIANDYLKRHPEEQLDLRLLEEMGMLHDIGIFQTDTPFLYTTGSGPYINHLSKGAKLLEAENLPLHANAARTHHDLTPEEIQEQDLLLPAAEYVPQTPEEEILSLADRFYSKQFESLFTERPVEEVRAYLLDNNPSGLGRFNALFAKYCE